MRIFWILILLCQVTFSQYIIKGTFSDSLPTVKSMALYKLKRDGAKYLTYVEVKNKQFAFAMDTLTSGIYRVFYRNNGGFADVIYNNEDVEFTMDSKRGQKSVRYQKSVENNLLKAYEADIDKLIERLDALQVVALKGELSNVSDYTNTLNEYEEKQKEYEQKSKGLYVNHFIKASKRYFASEPFINYLDFIDAYTAHFFDYIDLTNPILKDSPFLQDKIKEYVFGITYDNDVMVHNKRIIEATQNLDQFIEDLEYKEIIYRLLLEGCIQGDNKLLHSSILDIYYSLPSEYQNQSFLKKTIQKARVLLGSVAPDFELGFMEKLHHIEADKLLLVFWSSSCAHCQIEIPRLYKYFKNNPDFDLKVVAVGLEDKENFQKWQESTAKLPDWIHVYAEGKWENPLSDIYDLQATPSYFLLDSQKRIFAKPYNDKALEELFEKNKR